MSSDERKNDNEYIASFDVGQKNLAYCIRDSNGVLCSLELLDIRARTLELSVKKLISCLDMNPLFSLCTTVLIEQQMRVNSQALAMQHYLYMYFIFRVPDTTLVYVPSRWKTSRNNAPKNMSYVERKKWAVNEATRLLLEENADLGYLNQLKEKKADDYADALLQLHAYVVTKNT